MKMRDVGRLSAMSGPVVTSLVAGQTSPQERVSFFLARFFLPFPYLQMN